VNSAAARWPTKRLRFLTAIPQKGEIGGVPDETEVSFVPMEAIGENGQIETSRTKAIAEVRNGYSYFAEGDVVLAKITPCFENGKGAIAKHLVNDVGFGTTELHVIRVGPGLDARFLFYVTKSHPFRKLGEAEMYGAGGQKRVPESFVRDFRVHVPGLDEQRVIADFLDREAAKIDDLVDCKSTLLRQLADREQALITSAVCRGLNGSARTRATGILWIGDVPEHWELLHLRRVVKKFVDYRGRTPEKVPDGVPLVTAVNIKNGRIDLSLGQEFMPEADYDEWMVRGLPERGDLLVTTEAPLGEVAQIEDTRVALAQRIILLKVKKKKISNEYLKYFFLSAAGQGELWTRASGSTALGIKASRFKGITVIVPPLSEQSAIVDHLDRETSRLGQLKRAVEGSIPRLSEYRTSLISAAVTGQIDIRNYHPQEAAALCQ
jgi:type I restriction enzyme S subunit